MRQSRKRIARGNTLDLHDDNLLDINIHLSRAKINTTRIEFRFRDDSTKAEKVVSFGGCANIRYIMDFDVLAANWFAQTKQVMSEVDPNRMRRFVQAQTSHWHVKYMPPMPSDKPIRKKLSAIGSYRLFKISFFGGTAEILARSVSLKGVGKG